MKASLLTPRGLLREIRRLGAWVSNGDIPSSTIGLGKIIDPGTNRVIRSTMSNSNFSAVQIDGIQFVARTDSLSSIGGVGNSAAMAMLGPAMAGSGSFPTANLWDGRPYIRTDHNFEMYVYRSSLSGWLSVRSFQITGGDTASVTAGTYLRTSVDSASIRYSSAIGWPVGYPVKCTGIQAFIGTSSTTSIGVTAGGTDVTGASIAFSAESGHKIDDTLASNTIAANTVLALRNVGAGTATAGAAARATFRRFET